MIAVDENRILRKSKGPTACHGGTIPGSELRPELERNCLAALLAVMHREPQMLGDCLDICEAAAFVTPDAQPLAQALDLLRRSGERPGLETLARQMQARWSREPKKWPRPDLAGLADMCATVWGNRESALYFARALADEHRRETLRAGLLELAAEAGCYGANPDELAASARKLGDVVVGTCAAPDMSAVMARVMARVESGGPQDLLATPWESLNRVLRGGLMRQELMVLAGRPGTGKTALAGCLAVETARAGRGVVFVSREMGDEALGVRMLAREARVDNRFYREGLAGPQTRKQLQDASERIGRLPLSIVEKAVGPLCPREVRRLARGMKNLGLVVVDYLQLMQPDEPSRSREQDIASMSRAFKTLAMDLDVPVIVLSQLNRSLEQAEREPRVSDLRESGAIEQDADIVLLLHARRQDRTSSTPTVKAIVGKSRSTRTGFVFLTFDKAFSDFREGLAWEKRNDAPEEDGL